MSAVSTTTALPFLPFARPDIGDTEIAAVTDALRAAPHNRCPQLIAELDRVVTHIEVGSVKLEV